MMFQRKRNWIVICASALLAAACAEQANVPPTSAEIESVAIQANQGQQQKAARQLQQWAGQGLPVAQRELALMLQTTPAGYAEARQWFEKAGTAGDGEAAYAMGDAYYYARLGLTRNAVTAWKWYGQAAQKGDDRAALMLSRMAKYGDGVPQDLALSVKWLKSASEQGNAQAMFLLSNAYLSGDGVEHDEAKARTWLEKSAQGDFPVAIQALALATESGDLELKKDPDRARHLLKEATEERRMHWNKAQ
ncbi:tetratricopeptide repeat protein [Undibacterium sp.]|uniref:tetratricopeptide repeat protein n=1 Tax=Undibacterium sp. TaxID=1914977 RepID=UPI00374D1F9D